MNRRNGSGKFTDYIPEAESVNPMEGLANLADVMLVFACGLMMALITYWNVDVAGLREGAVSVDQGQEVTDVAGLGDGNGESLDDGQLEEYGTVFRDPATGKLYMVTEED